MGLAGVLLVRAIEVIVIIVLILVMPSIPPNITFTAFQVTPAQELKGKLALNNRLDNVEHIFENQLKGAEAFAEYNGELYSSLFTGEVIKISKGQFVPIAQFGKPCAGYHEEPICGRPLGLEFDKNGLLYVTDAYYGIWRVDVKTGQKTQVVSMDKEIEGKKPMLPNDIALSENGDFYWTDSSTQFELQDGVFDMLADGSGRLIHYNSKTKTNKVLMDGLHFANGVKLSSDEEFLIVSESRTSRIYRYYLKGPKAGTHDVFADGLPGLPDNINSDGRDGFFVSLFAARDVDHPSLVQVIAPHPWLRKFIARILGITEATFKTIHKIYPNMYSQWAIHMVGHFESMALFYPSRTTILHYSKNGELIEALYGLDKSFAGVSDAFIHQDHLYLGNPHNTFIGRIPLSNVGLEHLRKKREVPVQQKVEPKVQATPTTPKPTTEAPPTKPKPVREARNEPPPPQMKPEELKVITKPPPTQPPQKQTPPPSKPTPSPQKQSPPPAANQKPAPTPQKQPPPPPANQKPTPTPQKQPPPPPANQKPTPTPQKQSPPPPANQKPTPTPQKQSPPPPAPTPQKQSPPANQNQPPPPAKQKETPKVVPVKENSVPKPRV